MMPSNVIDFRRNEGRTLAITGGKGGVGKSMVAVNLAATYAARKLRTLVFDGDLGMADLNLLLGVAPPKSVLDLLKGSSLDDVTTQAHGLYLLPGLNGSHQLANLTPDMRRSLHSEITTASASYDRVVVDTAAGIDESAMSLASWASEVVVVVTTEPLSLADAYAAIKVLSTQYNVARVYLLPNQVRSPEDADEITQMLKTLCGRFLDVEIVDLPAIPLDPMVPLISATGTPIVIANPDTPASRAISKIARILEVVR
jgi:flagellar biosynthesis protein FlhG